MGFRKEGGFGGGRGGGHKKSFGGSRFGDKKPFGQGGGRNDRQVEMFSAVCAKCQKACEVPFRPNGVKPIFCRDCFGGKGDAPRGDFARRDNSRSFESRGLAFAPHAPRPQTDDRRIDELKRQIDAVHNKLDVVVKMIEGLTPKVSDVVIDESIKPIKKAIKTKRAKK